MSRVIKTENLRLAAIRYYSKGVGVEVSDPVGYKVLEEYGKDTYINPLNISDEYPIFERAPYANVNNDGFEYGSKMRLVNDVNVSGPCYVLFNTNLKDSFEEDLITVEDLEEYILRSNYYFRERSQIALDRIKYHPIQMLRILKKDTKSEEKYNKFFEERRAVVYKK